MSCNIYEMAKPESDFDKQYQEDLEKAQALSLESLALEQFKNKKRLKDLVRNVTDTTKHVSGSLV